MLNRKCKWKGLSSRFSASPASQNPRSWLRAGDSHAHPPAAGRVQFFHPADSWLVMWLLGTIRMSAATMRRGFTSAPGSGLPLVFLPEEAHTQVKEGTRGRRASARKPGRADRSRLTDPPARYAKPRKILRPRFLSLPKQTATSSVA